MLIARGRQRLTLTALTSLASAALLIGADATLAAKVLITYDEAARVGLERAWFAQTPIDASRSRISRWFADSDQIYSVSDSGIVTALNAETGAQAWSRRVGRSGAPAFGPDSNDRYLGVVSGSTMYMLDRATGRVKWSRDVGGAPSSGPALSHDYGYIALATGRIEGYKLDDPEAQPWYYQSKGRTYLRPTATGSVVSWPTSEGYLYVGRAENPGVLFRLETNADIVTSPAEMAPYLYIASLDGYLYCVHELTGNEQWRYSTGYPITSSPAIVGKHYYVASSEPALHCLDASTGALLWSVRGASHFAAQGKDRVYASDHYGNLLVIDAQTGSLLGRAPTAEGIFTLVNDKTDRVFLVNDRGLVQCLREIGATHPVLHRPPDAVELGEGAGPRAESGGEATPFQEEAPAADQPAAADAPGGAAPDAEAEADVGEGDAPAEPPADDNPFDEF